MISSLRGKVIHKFNNSIIVEVSGVGYKIFISASLYLKIKNNSAIFLFIYEHIREDTRDLYGFKNSDELNFFEKIIGVSGVGPKMALNIISIRKIDEIKKAIERTDIGFLTDLKGVGKKIAQKIILELRGKLANDENNNEDDEIIDALKNLGYSPVEIREIIKKIPNKTKDTEKRLRQALKMLAR